MSICKKLDHRVSEVVFFNYPAVGWYLSSNVLTPFASGCRAVFTIPHHEKSQEKPKSIGLGDPLVRRFIPEDMVSFLVPSNKFVEMAKNIEGSFLDRNFKNPTGF